MKLLFIGDIFAQTGLRAIKALLPKIRFDHQIDFVIANAENATDCRGLCEKDYHELMNSGVDFFTMGNHTWNHSDIFQLLSTKNNIIRPANININHQFAKVGVGTKIICLKDLKIRITSLMGESIKFPNNLQTNPFFELHKIISDLDAVDFHLVDFHAESTGEKNALFFEFQGQLQAIVGTHTHVQTADNRIRNNTAYITDVGSTGPVDGVIGAKGKNITDKHKHLTTKLIVEEQGGLYQFCAVVIEFDSQNKKVKSIERILIYE